MRKHLSGSLIAVAALAARVGLPETGRGEAPAPGAAAPAAPAAAPADDKGPIKVGILHSLSGTMAISETSLKDVALMTIEEINEKGGVLGRKLEPVVVDPASELAAVRREGARPDPEGEGRGHLRLLDLGVAQVGAAGVRGAERPALLPGAVRG